eukprot:TRINITY_DN12112_c0_g1_i1.p1 TRINITY_DN12112_c0_g1~~TRINITY_DN12112_c0_g1_i1.p1  ORF type:complete len:411 (-),score=89.25 TRINITY_DN12112_c0_g1_i1:54-1286(-)
MKEQDMFLNAVCEIEFQEPEGCGPTWLLGLCKQLERTLGRTEGAIRNGPRPIDLDILYYLTPKGKHVVMSSDELSVPHKAMAERSFVLLPLMDLGPDTRHPVLNRSTADMVELLVQGTEGVVDIDAVLTFPYSDPTSRMMATGSCTLLMGVLNHTPDSFSDGGIDRDLSEAVARGVAMLEHGADIVDIGGQSTRPGAKCVGLEEELARVVPVVVGLRECCPSAFISVDTSSAEVARQCLQAGASMLNDVTAGVCDPGILKVAAEHQVPIVLMHSRGTPETMADLQDYNDLLPQVVKELRARVEAALEAGIYSWNIVLDPGIGFAKNMDQNMELLRQLPKLKQQLAPYPVLLGTSRKRFIGTITHVERPEERLMVTVASCVAGVAAGIDLLRVHDVQQMKQATLMADAIYR